MGTIRDCVKLEDFGKADGCTVDFPVNRAVCLVDDIDKQISSFRYGMFRGMGPCYWNKIEPYPDSHHIE